MGLLEAHAGLAGKVAVVVGGAGGFIGRGVTLALAKAGVHVAACDNDEEAVRTIVPDVEALGSRILSFRTDVTDADALDAFYERRIVARRPMRCMRGPRPRPPTSVVLWPWSSAPMASGSISSHPTRRRHVPRTVLCAPDRLD